MTTKLIPEPGAMAQAENENFPSLWTDNHGIIWLRGRKDSAMALFVAKNAPISGIYAGTWTNGLHWEGCSEIKEPVTIRFEP